jgi:transcriptional regulator with XRE-family HTH domain
VRLSEEMPALQDRASGEVAMSTGARVRRARQHRGMTLEATAGLVGRSKGWLSLIENGRLPLEKLTDIIALAGVLGVPVPVLTGIPCPGCPRTRGGDGSGR